MCSMFTLYSIPVSAPDKSRKKLPLVLEDPGTTHNFVKNELAKWMKLPSKPSSLTVRVLGDNHKKQGDEDIQLKPRGHVWQRPHGTSHSL